MDEQRPLLIACALFFLTSCSGGGTSSSPSTPDPSQPLNPPSSSQPPQTGVFTDSPVAGLRYVSQSHSGVTNSLGQFTYQPGETITFSLGSVQLGSTTGASEISPLDLVGANDLDDAEVKGAKTRLQNILIFLQSLDRDHDPENGIDLTGLNDEITGVSLDFDQDLDTFTNGEYRRLVHAHNGILRSPRKAINHLLRTLGQSVTISLPSRDAIDRDGDGIFDIQVNYEYDESGRPTTVTSEDSEGNLVATTTMSYDESGLPSRITFIDENGPEYSQDITYHSEFGIEKISIFRDGEIVMEIENTFDEIGKLLVTRSSTYAQVPVNIVNLHGVLSTSLPVVPLSSSTLVNPGPYVFQDAAFVAPPPAPVLISSTTTETRFEWSEDGALQTVRSQLPVSSVFGTRILDIVSNFADNKLVSQTQYQDGELLVENTLDYSIDPDNPRCTTNLNDGSIAHTGTWLGTGDLFSGYCLSTDDGSIERDLQGRIVETLRKNRTLGFINPFPGDTRTTYTYVDDLLVERRQESSNSTIVIRFEHDDLGNLVEEVRSIKNTGESDFTIIYRRVREYITLVLNALPG